MHQIELNCYVRENLSAQKCQIGLDARKFSSIQSVLVKYRLIEKLPLLHTGRTRVFMESANIPHEFSTTCLILFLC